MEPIDTARIAEKVRRLLALSTSSNEHEAAAAAAKAQELLHRYNLSMADVSAAERPDYGREIVDIGNSASWRGVLLQAIAKPNGAYVVGLGAGRYAIIGQPHTIEVCRYLYEYLSREIDRLADQAWSRYSGYESSSRRWKTSFRFGAVSIVADRLQRQRQAQEAEPESRALIIRDDAAVKAAVTRYYPRLAQQRVRAGTSSSGYRAGQQAGASMGLHTGIGATSQRLAGFLR